MALSPMDVVLTAPLNNGGSPIVSYRVDGVPATAGQRNITVTGLGKALSLTQARAVGGAASARARRVYSQRSTHCSSAVRCLLPPSLGSCRVPLLLAGAVPVCSGQLRARGAVHLLGLCHQWSGHGPGLYALQLSCTSRVRKAVELTSPNFMLRCGMPYATRDVPARQPLNSLPSQPPT